MTSLTLVLVPSFFLYELDSQVLYLCRQVSRCQLVLSQPQLHLASQVSAISWVPVGPAAILWHESVPRPGAGSVGFTRFG